MSSRSSAAGDDRETGWSPPRRWLGVLGLGVVTVLGVVVMVNIHEIGHTLLARALGDTTASYHLFERYPDGGYCIGCNRYNPSVLTPLGVALVAVGGVVATQIIAVSAIVGRGMPKSVMSRRLLSIVAGVFFLDLVWQVIQGLAADITTQTTLTGVDLADFVFVVSRETALSPRAAMALIVAASVVYSAGLGFLVSRRAHGASPVS